MTPIVEHRVVLIFQRHTLGWINNGLTWGCRLLLIHFSIQIRDFSWSNLFLHNEEWKDISMLIQCGGLKSYINSCTQGLCTFFTVKFHDISWYFDNFFHDISGYLYRLLVIPIEKQNIDTYHLAPNFMELALQPTHFSDWFPSFYCLNNFDNWLFH